MRGTLGKTTLPSATAWMETSFGLTNERRVLTVLTIKRRVLPDCLQELVELLLDAGREHRAEVGDVCLAVVEVLQQLNAVAQASKDGELALERVLPGITNIVVIKKS